MKDKKEKSQNLLRVITLSALFLTTHTQVHGFLDLILQGLFEVATATNGTGVDLGGGTSSTVRQVDPATQKTIDQARFEKAKAAFDKESGPKKIKSVENEARKVIDGMKRQSPNKFFEDAGELSKFYDTLFTTETKANSTKTTETRTDASGAGHAAGLVGSGTLAGSVAPMVGHGAGFVLGCFAAAGYIAYRKLWVKEPLVKRGTFEIDLLHNVGEIKTELLDTVINKVFENPKMAQKRLRDLLKRTDVGQQLKDAVTERMAERIVEGSLYGKKGNEKSTLKERIEVMQDTFKDLFKNNENFKERFEEKIISDAFHATYSKPLANVEEMLDGLNALNPKDPAFRNLMMEDMINKALPEEQKKALADELDEYSKALSKAKKGMFASLFEKGVNSAIKKQIAETVHAEYQPYITQDGVEVTAQEARNLAIIEEIAERKDNTKEVAEILKEVSKPVKGKDGIYKVEFTADQLKRFIKSALETQAGDIDAMKKMGLDLARELRGNKDVQRLLGDESITDVIKDVITNARHTTLASGSVAQAHQNALRVKHLLPQLANYTGGDAPLLSPTTLLAMLQTLKNAKTDLYEDLTDEQKEYLTDSLAKAVNDPKVSKDLKTATEQFLKDRIEKTNGNYEKSMKLLDKFDGFTSVKETLLEKLNYKINIYENDKNETTQEASQETADKLKALRETLRKSIKKAAEAERAAKAPKPAEPAEPKTTTAPNVDIAQVEAEIEAEKPADYFDEANIKENAKELGDAFRKALDIRGSKGIKKRKELMDDLLDKCLDGLEEGQPATDRFMDVFKNNGITTRREMMAFRDDFFQSMADKIASGQDLKAELDVMESHFPKLLGEKAVTKDGKISDSRKALEEKIMDTVLEKYKDSPDRGELARLLRERLPAAAETYSDELDAATKESAAAEAVVGPDTGPAETEEERRKAAEAAEASTKQQGDTAATTDSNLTKEHNKAGQGTGVQTTPSGDNDPTDDDGGKKGPAVDGKKAPTDTTTGDNDGQETPAEREAAEAEEAKRKKHEEEVHEKHEEALHDAGHVEPVATGDGYE